MEDVGKKPKDKRIHCKNLHDYLKTLTPEVLDRLYNHPATCLAVFRYVLCIILQYETNCVSLLFHANKFRELPDIARHYVLRLLFVEQSVPQAVVSSWVSQAFSK
jgi:transcription initiation factor TFIIH subunit 4